MRVKTITSFLVYTLLSIFMTACAASRPVLYPNNHLNSVGMQAADADIDACITMAKSAGAEQDKISKATEETLEGAVIGGTTGAAVGAVLGNVGRGAATGAAGTATGSLTRSLLRSDDRPDPVFQKFVDRCLRDQGYEPVGWR